MSVLYIKEQGAILVKRSERLQVTKGNHTYLDIPVANIDNISIIGNVQISTQALIMLMEKGIDINYFTFSGKYIGQTAAESSRNIFLRFAQHELYHNINSRMEIARTIVRNKIDNQIRVIEHHSFQKEYNYKIDINRMKVLQDTLSDRKTPNEILGVEGLCSNVYFGAFGKMFKCDIRFDGRNRRPPKDPINVILSLGYTFLTKDVCNALESASFEMYLGFLHGIRYGRKSLALDIVEEFRQPIIDRMVIISFNKRMFTEYDFEVEEDAIRLTEEGFGKFCKIYENWMQDRHYSGRRQSFRELIKVQANSLKKSVQDKVPYVPYLWKEEE